MRSTIKEIMTHNTFLFSCFLALTLPYLSVANAAPIESECSYDKEKMLELSPKAFDQNYDEGWPSLVKNGECLKPAADLIHLYYTKNKVSVPFRECEFELMYNEGLNAYAGTLKQLEGDGLVKRNGAWYTVDGTEKKFQSKEFLDLLLDPQSEGFEPLRKFFGL